MTIRKSGIFLEDAFVVRESTVFPPAESGPGIEPEAREEATAPAPPPSAAETGPAPTSYEAETAPAAEKKSVVPQTETEIAKVDQKSVLRGDGRNLAKKSISVAYRHSYVEYPTELVSRTAISTSGGTTTSRTLSPEAFADADLDTVMHIDAIRLRFGITDFLEIYGDLGTAYRNFATPQFVYGVGARINVLSIELDGHRSIYGAIQGDFLAGKLEEEYDSDDGRRWKKETDWQNIDLKLEIGFGHEAWRLYGGATYGLYDETTDRTLLSTPPAPLTRFVYADELEQENAFGGLAGFDYYVFPRFMVNFEGQFGSQYRITGHFQYDF